MDALRRGVELVVLGCVLLCAFGFNVDTQHAIIREPEGLQAGDMGAFGASVTIHKTKGGHSLLVGAPKYTWPTDTVERRGAIFKCNITGDSQCKYELLEQQLNLGPLLADQFNTSDQLFGQTLVSSLGNVMVCSPLFRLNTTREIDNPLPSFYPVGRCMLFNEDLNLQSVYSPTTTKAAPPSPDPSYIQGQFGFSAALDQSYLVVGCPRCFEDNGNAFIDKFEKVVNEGRKANEEPTIYDNQNEQSGNYLGFSVAIGRFFGVFNNPIVMYAVGRPRAENMKGEVVVFRSQLIGFTDQLVLQTAVLGEEVGAMFGYAITVADLNRDGFSDLVVGAPFHGDLRSPNMGRIVAYLSDQRSKFREPQVVTGNVAGGMLGLAVSSVGDLDLDGFDDVAIAAPFLGTSRGGEVHIYRGSAEGLIITRSQVIKLKETPLKSLGFALTNAVDIDDNKYPDILVGAYEVQKVVLFRTRPVVTVTIEAVAQPNAVKLHDPNCTYEGGITSCFDLVVSFKFDVKEKAPNISHIDVQYTVLLDTEVTTEKRLVMKDKDGKETSKLTEKMELKNGATRFATYYVFVQKNIRNRLREFVNEVNLEEVTLVSPVSSELPKLDPVQDDDKPSKGTAVVTIKKNCQSDVCKPNLDVQIVDCATLSITAGTEDVSFHIRVTNNFESSYGTKLSVVVDRTKLVFSRANFSACSGMRQTCDPSLRCELSDTGALCEVGNPLKRSDSVDLTVVFRQRGSILGNEGELTVKVNASSVDPDIVTADNERICTINIAAKVIISVDGTPIPPSGWNIDDNQVVNLISGKDDLRNFTHLYRLKNNGPSPLTGMKARFWWPVFGVGQTRLLEAPKLITVVGADLERCIVPKTDASEWPKAEFGICKDTICMPIDCQMQWNRAQPLRGKRSVIVNITSTLNLRNLLQYVLEQQGDVSNPLEKLTSTGEASVLAEGYRIDNESLPGSVTTNVLFNIDVQECVEIWIPIVSGLGAVLLLAVAVAILYRLGFFGVHKKHSLEIRQSRSSEKRTGASGVGATQTVGSDEKQLGGSSSNRQSTSDAFDGEEIFKKGAVELRAESGAAKWRASDSGNNAPDTSEFKEEPRRQSQSSHSQTTV